MKYAKKINSQKAPRQSQVETGSKFQARLSTVPQKGFLVGGESVLLSPWKSHRKCNNYMRIIHQFTRIKYTWVGILTPIVVVSYRHTG